MEDNGIDGIALPSPPLITQPPTLTDVGLAPTKKRAIAMHHSIQKTVQKQAREQPRFAQFRVPTGQASSKTLPLPSPLFFHFN